MRNDIHFLVPTRARPQAAKELYEAWCDNEDGHSTIQFIVDADDPEIDGYQALIDDEVPFTFNTTHKFIGPILNDVVNQILNYTSALPPYAIGFMGDDHRPRTKGFDRIMCDALSEFPSGSGIVYGDDLLQHERIPTAVVATTDIIETLGFFVPLTLKHLCFDVYWLRLGQILDRIRYLPDVVIEHMHPAALKAEMDAGYERVNSPEMISDDGTAWREILVDQLWDDAAKVKAIL